jgi:Phospholipase_D-nuclease N-terminal
MISGLIGLLIFIADIFGIAMIIKSSDTPGAKVLWCLLILVLPVVGLIIWYLAGPKGNIKTV